MIYRALWRLLPGPPFVRVLILLGLVAGVLVVFDQWLFPWVAATFFDDGTGTVGGPQG
ncbi:hypothetical protein [Sinomonas sp. ASV322]|uniref:hypothetical protein n=1 Tax=Sinomonas sp. ASV322 TaxID=3041920 RepID=UPI0027DC27B7|nr:hypothetical protein [Sinomonas sp. ASV322]MDQ4502971.1 hypothetical protein [Sinomonas sp. ASV322]